MKVEHKQIYDFVVGYILDHKYPPSVREIAAGVGYKSTSSVHYHLQAMYAEGILETDSGLDRPRAIRVPELVITRTGSDK